MLLAGNSIEHVVCYLGVMAYGATICTVHMEMNRPHLPRILAQLRPRVVIHDEGIELRGECVPRRVADRSLRRAGRGTAFSQASIPIPTRRSFRVETTARDDGVIFFTSGTSDTPKAWC